MEELVLVLGARVFTAKKTGVVYGAVDYILLASTPEEGAKGFVPVNAFVDTSLAMSVPGPGYYKATYAMVSRFGKPSTELVNLVLVKAVDFKAGIGEKG